MDKCKRDGVWSECASGKGGQTLTVALSGTGSGSVWSAPAVISCGIGSGIDCTQAYASGTPVTLTAIPTAGSSFAGWSGACSGTSTCVVTMNSAISATTTFTLNIVPPPTPTNKNECKNNGWKTFTNPTFKNQGQCVSYTNHN